MCKNIKKEWNCFLRIFLMASCIAALLFTIATGVVMLCKKSEVDLWIVLVACVSILLITAICYTINECRLVSFKEKEIQEKKDHMETLYKAYENIFMQKTTNCKVEIQEGNEAKYLEITIKPIEK